MNRAFSILVVKQTIVAGNISDAFFADDHFTKL